MYIAQSSSAGQFSVSLDYSSESDVTVDGFSATSQCAYGWSAFGLADITHTVVVTTLDVAMTFELDHFL
jgi:hypothetical protein